MFVWEDGSLRGGRRADARVQGATEVADRLPSQSTGVSRDETRSTAGQVIPGGTDGLAKTESSWFRFSPGIGMESSAGSVLVGVPVGWERR